MSEPDVHVTVTAGAWSGLPLNQTSLWSLPLPMEVSPYFTVNHISLGFS